LQPRTLIVGFCALAIGVATILLPLVLPRTDLNKYVVVAGFIVGCWGVCCLLLGATDRLGARRWR